METLAKHLRNNGETSEKQRRIIRETTEYRNTKDTLEKHERNIEKK